MLIAVDAEDHSPAIRGLFLSHSQFMVPSRVVEEGLQLLLNQFDRGFIWRGVALAGVARSVPAILHIDRVENGEHFVTDLVEVDLAQHVRRLGEHRLSDHTFFVAQAHYHFEGLFWRQFPDQIVHK